MLFPLTEKKNLIASGGYLSSNLLLERQKKNFVFIQVANADSHIQASVNVGGTVLNVVSIEHLILRHSPDAKQVCKKTSRTQNASSFSLFH